MAIAVGSKAPDFTLKSKTASGLVDVKLSENLGKKSTVLLFFPLAFTGVCTQEMCDVTAGLNAYSGLNADVIAVSVDSPFSQEAWAQKEKIGITLASDLNKKVAEAYGTRAAGRNVARRVSFLIGLDGKIAHVTDTPSADVHLSEMKDAVAKLAHP